jgi:hypothetical protein
MCPHVRPSDPIVTNSKTKVRNALGMYITALQGMAMTMIQQYVDALVFC